MIGPIELKPCPFCGDKMLVVRDEGVYFKCPSCFGQSGRRATYETAVEALNSRFSLPSAQAPEGINALREQDALTLAQFYLEADYETKRLMWTDDIERICKALLSQPSPAPVEPKEPSVQSALNSEGELVEALEKLSDPYCRGAVEIARAAMSKYRSRRVG